MSRTNRRDPCLVVHCVSSLLVGGMEHMVLRLARAQRDRGYDARILAFQPGPLLEEAHTVGVPAEIAAGSGRVARALSTVRYFARNRPSVIHAHNVSSLHFASVGKRLTGAALVLTCHGEFQANHRKPSEKEWQQVDRVIAVSEVTAAQVRIPQTESKLQVVYNGVSVGTRETDREKIRGSLGLAGSFTGIMVARIDLLKGHRILLQALELIRESASGLRLLFVGDGEQREEMEKISRDLGLSNISFTGFRTDVADLLSAADFFVLPSFTEGLPLSMLEAMAHRLPIIATPVGGVPELIEEGVHGLFVPVNDAPALAQGIERLYADRAFAARLGANGRKRVEDLFSFDRMVTQYSEVYAAGRSRS